MARIAGVNIPLNKHIRISLTYIYGVGPRTAASILKQAGVKGDIKTKDLTEDQVKAVRDLVEKGRRLEGDLRRDVLSNVKRLKEIGVKEINVFVRGVGAGRDSAVRALNANGFQVLSIKDLTPLPHNGCRPRKPRRV